jgi:hypothetical protein
MGPGDGFLLQYSRATDRFWADSDRLALGHCFKPRIANGRAATPPRTMVTKV